MVPSKLGSERFFHSHGLLATGEVDEDGEVVFRRMI
jgi:hypothetical protein